ncbi:hypothetical protein [Streptomyces sp. NPDC050804]|uniref:hypothetical protein n=1 Tax=Streptomyces sp. NPDC050804 TaxID=3154745 RepID=UPI00343FB396
MSEKPAPFLWQSLNRMARRIAARQQAQRQARAVNRAREAALVSLGESLARLAALQGELVRRELENLDNPTFFEQVFGRSSPKEGETE